MATGKKVVVAAAAVALGLAGCGSPSASNGSAKDDSGTITTATQAIDAAAKGPAAEIAGAVKGGTITVYSGSTPNNMDPTDIYYTDSGEIAKLLFRTPTQYDVRNGTPVLVPDLTDLGTVSADKLTWTFKLQAGLKYEDGSAVKVEDLAYAIKRSFAHDVFPDGATYQQAYFKDGDKYKGPYAGGDKFAGVETQGADTLIVHLAKPFPDLPYYMTFPLFTPIPQAKDTKQEYQSHPMATGPYKYASYTPGSELKLVRNTNWDANTDPARHQYPDGFDFKWGQDDVKTQQQVLNSAGGDANAINYVDVDASLVPQVLGDKKAQLVQGNGPCTYVWQMDTTKIPLEVRKAIAAAWPYDQTWKAAGISDLIGQKASTIMPPSVPGYTKYNPLPGLSGTGQGDPAAAKKMLEAAGKVGFEVSWFFDNTKPVSQQVSQVRADALKAAGFKVRPVGVATADLRTKISDYKSDVNMAQGPRGWCSDWPNGNSWFPVLFESSSVGNGLSWGMMQDKALDSEIESIGALPAEEAATKWGALDEKIMGMYVGIPFYYTKAGVVQGTNVGSTVVDPTQGMPFFQNMYLKS
ncbi:ABC transporter [Actinoplanes ianthinogenes]|uniref:ABC transporter n=1 Tax=Actinoplanes ianthinogenes TaxID=122358 RepID=A0ABM7LS47_9ACTN|nr:ABC transporter substrate-binding protein [Actinoplanes ianthinogenes]BCJ42075.1 ABC transporter [Actinoplanes ianthinogenes]GGR37835.1 ABC transporter [Actinoplanes ianthinogenes]